MSTRIDEVRELHELNVELLDTLILIGKRFFEYTMKYHLEIEGMGNLATLLARAQHIIEQIGTPYHRNPVLSDAILHPKPSDKDFTEPDPRLCCVAGTRFGLLQGGTGIGFKPNPADVQFEFDVKRDFIRKDCSPSNITWSSDRRLSHCCFSGAHSTFPMVKVD